jgi:hypothetical protein
VPIPRPEFVWQILEQLAAASAPIVAAQASRQHEVPAELSSFVGRQRERIEIWY